MKRSKRPRMERGRVYDIGYRAMIPHPFSYEDGTVRAYWNGEVDTWGKLTLIPVDDSEPLFLFRHEVISIESV